MFDFRILSCAATALFALACAPVPTASDVDLTGAERIDGWTDEQLDVYFVPGSAAEDRIAQEIEDATDSIRVAMYNIRSPRLGWLLLEKQHQGLDVEVMWDAKQMVKEWNTLDDELIANGLHIVPITNDNHAYATLHDKLVVIDGERVFMGTANWGNSGLYLNNETMLAIWSPQLASVVEAELDEVKTGEKNTRAGDVDSHIQLYFSPEDRLDHVVEDQIDAATDSIHVAVFSLRLDWLADALVRAHQRGVTVTVITDEKQSTNTDVDEILKDAGIPVVEALNTATEFTAMHHKFMVIDGDTTVVGSYNWTYTATMWSYEDLAVIEDDAEVAAAFEGEIGRLWSTYAPEEPSPISAQMPVDVRAYCDGTAWGDQLVLVGDHPDLGSWNPAEGVVLSGATWPSWTASFELTAGSRVEYKLVVLRADGSVDWERGGNRIAWVPTDPGEPSLSLDDNFRW